MEEDRPDSVRDPLLKSEDEDKEPPVYDFEGLINAAGGFGRMQLICLIICFISLNGANYYSFTLSFLELAQDFKCGPEGSRESCEMEDICDEHHNILPRDQWEIDWSSGTSLNNWMTEMEMFCYSSFRIGLFGSLWLLGFAFCGVLLKLGDYYGRRPVLIIGAITNVCFTFGLYFINNIYSRYVQLFLYGVTCAKVVCTYIYVTEISPKKAGVFCCGLINCTDIVALIPTSLYFLFISQDWRWFYIAPMVIACVTAPMVFFLPESPKFLYEKGKYSELRKVMKRISTFNRVQMDQNYVIDRAVQRSSTVDKNVKIASTETMDPKEGIAAESFLQEVEYSIWKELKRPIILINLTVCTILFVVSTFNYYMINFYLKYVGGNIFINVILSTISENIAYNVGSVMESRLGLRKSFVASFASAIAFAVPLIIWDDVEWLIMICVFCSRFGIAASFTLVYYVNQEIFPTLFVPFSFTVCNFAARFIAILAPEIAEIPKPFPVISFIVMAGVAIFSVFFMRKTKSELEEKFEEASHSKPASNYEESIEGERSSIQQ